MGYEYEYDEITQHLQPAMEYGDNKEVIDILDMFRAIHNACNTNVDCVDLDSRYLKFGGFDGNFEGAQYLYARFLLENKGLFQESKPETSDGYNSHYRLLPKYRRMVKVWRESIHIHDLTHEEIANIINA